ARARFGVAPVKPITAGSRIADALARSRRPSGSASGADRRPDEGVPPPAFVGIRHRGRARFVGFVACFLVWVFAVSSSSALARQSEFRPWLENALVSTTDGPL